jgi:hypothetical protein
LINLEDLGIGRAWTIWIGFQAKIARQLGDHRIPSEFRPTPSYILQLFDSAADHQTYSLVHLLHGFFFEHPELRSQPELNVIFGQRGQIDL